LLSRIREPLAAIVIRENHDRVVRESEAFDRLQKFSDALIDGFHHRDVIGAGRSVVLLRQLLRAGARRGRRFSGWLIRPVRGIVGNVHEERLVGSGTLLDESNRPVRNEIGHVLAVELRIDARVILPKVARRRATVVVISMWLPRKPKKYSKPCARGPVCTVVPRRPIPNDGETDENSSVTVTVSFHQDNVPTFRDGSAWPDKILDGEGRGREAGYKAVHARTLFDNGVVYRYGTDTGYLPIKRWEQELKTLFLMFSMKDIVKVMGPNSAALVDMSKDSTLEPGKLADIVLLGSNPMDGFWSMLNVRATIKGGVVLYEKK
jgi:hypothetical protein